MTESDRREGQSEKRGRVRRVAGIGPRGRGGLGIRGTSRGVAVAVTRVGTEGEGEEEEVK